ncbi:hypothetical protein MMC20_000160 [Loxospora ochrophaea]|nr:hypothetical protein [Loxospora ochrophaea]
MSKALLVIDMQNGFREMTNEALPNIIKLISEFRSRSLPCIFIQHGYTTEELTPPYKNQLVRKWGPEESVVIGSHEWKLIPEIAAVVEDAPVVRKNTYDAFINTNLSEILEEQKVETVFVCGLETDCCCETTSRSAFCRGFETWLVEDACGAENEKQHEAGLRGFDRAFGEVIKAEEVIKRIHTA